MAMQANRQIGPREYFLGLVAARFLPPGDAPTKDRFHGREETG